jgi:ketosteroid isomerase-like protein
MVAKSFFRSAVIARFLLLSAGSLVLLVGTVPVLAVAIPTVPRAERHESRHEIEQLEETWRNAILKTNTAALDALLSDDYTGITASGAIQTKQQAINSLRSGALQVSSLAISDRKVRIYGGTAVVTSLAVLTGSKKDQQVTGRYRYTRVYVRNPLGQWKIVSFEASRIQEPGERR